MNHSFNVKIACMFDERCALLIQHIDFWLNRNKIAKSKKYFHEGTYWTKFSLPEICETFPYMSKDQVQRALNKLKNGKPQVIRVGKFSQEKSDRTNWYTFTEEFLNSPCGEWLLFTMNSHDAKSRDAENSHDAKSRDVDDAKSRDVDDAKSRDGSLYVEKDIKDVGEEQKRNFDCWKKAFSVLEKRINTPTFNTWFRPIDFLSAENGVCYLTVPDLFYAKWLETEYKQVIEEALKQAYGKALSAVFKVKN